MKCSHLLVFCIAVLVSFDSVCRAHPQGQVVGWGSDYYNDVGQASPAQPSLLGYRQIEAGYGYSIALRADGSVVAWGRNEFKQCDVPAGLSGVVRVQAGAQVSVALKNDGTVVAWGHTFYGACNVPAGLSDVIDVAASSHVLALKKDGSVVAWGNNASHQCDVPPGVQGVTRVAVGDEHSLAIMYDSFVVAWGGNRNGQCDVPPWTEGIKQIAAGWQYSLALKSDATVIAWGSTTYGECSVPAALRDVTRIAAGGGHGVALRREGTVVCWGYNNFGQAEVPAGLAGVSEIAGGDWHTVVLLQDGSARAWGYNLFGECAVPSEVNRGITQVVAGGYHTTALRGDGTVVVWGYNGYRQCEVPAALVGVVQVAAGGHHNVAVTAAGTVTAWGAGRMNTGTAPQCGQSMVPTGLVGVRQVATGWYHTLAVTSAGTVAAWGAGISNTGVGVEFGQSVVPSDLVGVTQVSAGAYHSVALRVDGSVRGWGAGASSTPTGFPNYAQAQPVSLVGLRQVACGGYHTLAVKSDGKVAVWGVKGVSVGTDPNFGQAVLPTGLSAVESVAAGAFHSVALLAGGTVRAWGRNNSAQCVVPAGLGGVTQISAGVSHTLTLLAPALSECGNPSGAGTATIAESGTSWQSAATWAWSGGAGPQAPGALTSVDFGTFGTVGSECAAQASTLTARAGTALLVPASASAPGNDYSIRVGGAANLAGRLWLLGVSGGGSTLPENLDLPVLSAGTVNGTFDLIQSNVPPPSGYFLTLVPSDVNGRTVLSLKLLPLPGNAELSGANASTFAGTAMAAGTLDLNHDGFDDLALAVDFGAGQNGLIQVLLNDGAGNLGGTSVLCQIPPQPTCLAVGDVDGDGLKDVAVGIASDESARVYRDSGSGTLVAGTVIAAVGGTPKSVIVIPASGASVMPTSGSVGVGLSGSKLKIFTNGTLQQELSMAGTVETVKGGDTGGRSGTDIVTGGTKSASFTMLPALETGFVQVLRRQSNGLYAIVQSMYLTAKPKGVDVADLDGDGLDDIVTANADPVLPAAGSALPVLTIFRNTNGVFGGAVPYQPDGSSSGLSVSLVDADNDGDRDIVSVHRKVGTDSEAALLRVDTLGAGTPISIGQTTVLDASDPILAARGNLDGLGGDDLFLVDNGGGSFLTGTKSVTPYLAAGYARAADLDGSGVVDFGDVTLLMLEFGPCPGCRADLDGSGVVDFGDVVLVLLDFG